jgi:hypothetical protein
MSGRLRPTAARSGWLCPMRAPASLPPFLLGVKAGALMLAAAGVVSSVGVLRQVLRGEGGPAPLSGRTRRNFPGIVREASTDRSNHNLTCMSDADASDESLDHKTA